MSCRFNIVAIQRVTAAQHVATQAAVASNHTNTQTVIKADNATNKAGIIAAILEALGQFSLQSISSKLDDALERLGSKLPNGGLSGKLTRMSKWLQMDRVFNAVNNILILHNVLMLSRSAAETVGNLMSVGLQAMGLKDDEDQPIDINNLVGKGIVDWIKSIIGEAAYVQVSEAWKKANNILSAASNIYSTITSMVASSRSIMEWTAENTGKIGNALKKYGVVGRQAYPWMSENVSMKGPIMSRIDKLTQGIQGVEDTASSLTSVTSDVVSIQTEAAGLVGQFSDFDKHVKDAQGVVKPSNEPVKAKADAEVAASAAKPTTPSDRAIASEQEDS